jgi:hypothetical protein
MSFDASHLLYLAKSAAVLVAAALVFRVRVWPAVVWGLTFVAGVLSICVLGSVFAALGTDHRAGIDYRIFWGAGSDVWAGINPYAAERFAEHPFLHPPSALPLFATFALLPFRASFLLWSILNVVACAGLITLGQRTLAAQERLDVHPPGGTGPAWQLPEVVVLALTCALMISDASLLTLALGQLSIMAAVVLLGALAAQARGRMIAAGVLLALATAKVGTMLPFLLLFLRKTDWRTWVALAVTTLALCLATVPAAELPGRLATVLDRIKQLEAPGQVNDYSFEGTQPENILGFEHAFYRLGLRDRTVIRLAQYSSVLLLGAWVARQVVGRHRLPRAAACALVALYSTVFLYHRAYDTVILAPALVYCAGEARRAGGRSRWLFAGGAVAVLLVLNLDVGFLRALTRLSLNWGAWGRVVQALVLPYGTWLILLTMVLLVRGARAARAEAIAPLPHTAGAAA